MKTSLHLEKLTIIPSVFEPDTYYVEGFTASGQPNGNIATLNKKELLKLMTWLREELKPKIVG